MAGLYIHVPFCKQACYYCDFHFSTNQQNKADLLEALRSELILQKNYLVAQPINTIYFGGGTPSLLSHAELSGILKTIYTNFSVSDNPEITLEANPDDLTATKLQDLFDVGANRLSIGIQSFHDNLLKLLHRVHNAETAFECIRDARSVGFDNISIDLIYGIPGQSNEVWLEDIRKAVSLEPEHISCYALTIEEKTVFGKWRAAGKFIPTEDEVAAQHLELLMTELGKAGYEHYEISNFAKPGFYSKHNSSYWNQTQYLGIGPSAHSYNGVTRQNNISNNSLYVKAIATGEIPCERETLSVEDKINEYLLTTLRTQWGTDLKRLHGLYGYDLLTEQSSYLTELVEKKLAVIDADILKLTRSGKLLADKISSDLFKLPV